MSDVRNEDWTKTQTWDLPRTIAGLRTVVDLRSLPHLPCWEACPLELRVEIQQAIDAGIH
jgi:hypothetical protein